MTAPSSFLKKRHAKSDDEMAYLKSLTQSEQAQYLAEKSRKMAGEMNAWADTVQAEIAEIKLKVDALNHPGCSSGGAS
jgi:hypothetical protein